MLKIGFIAHGLSDGGAERVESLLANYLVSRGYSVLFIAAQSPGKIYCLDDRVTYTYLPADSHNVIIKLIQKNINVYRQMKAFNPDIIVSFLTNEAFVTGSLIDVPSLYTLRNDPYNYNNTGFKGIIRNYLFNKARTIVFQTIGAQRYFSETIQRKGVIIANPLKEDLPKWKDYTHEKVIVTACRLDKQKNIPMMLRAFSRFRINHPDYKLKICGDGKLKAELQTMAVNLGISESVEFMGFRTDIHDIMAHSMIFTLSSDYEGLSNSMLEAMSMGMPVICTDSSPGGAATYIKDSINGILVPVGDYEKLSMAFAKVADNIAFRNQLSENAANIRADLMQDAIFKKWEENICNLQQ